MWSSSAWYPWTRSAERAFRKHFGAGAEAFPVFNGTAANVLSGSLMAAAGLFGPAAEDWRPPDGPPCGENRVLVRYLARDQLLAWLETASHQRVAKRLVGLLTDAFPGDLPTELPGLREPEGPSLG